MGLGGIAFALLGCQDVTLTDKSELMPLLQKNVNANLSNSALAGSRSGLLLDSLVTVEV